MRAVVTAGGTSEPIDDVRVVTNLSSGRTGLGIARALRERGVEVVLLAGPRVDARDIPADVQTVRFGSAAELEAALHAQPAPDLLFMAAAVADYSPVPHEGKLSSDADELVIRMRRNPKLLAGLRERWGEGSFLVGFKLLSGNDPDPLLAAARRQIQAYGVDLVFANLLQEVGRDSHAGWMVLPGGGSVRLEGARDEVARELVNFCLRVRGAWRPPVSRSATPPHRQAGFDQAGALLRFARRANLSTARLGLRRDGATWASPADPDAPEPVHIELTDRGLRHRSHEAPHSAAASHAELLARLPEPFALLELRDALVLPDATTAVTWPENSLERAGAVVEALGRAATRGRWRGGPFAIAFAEGGHLVGITDELGLLTDWASVLHEQAEATGHSTPWGEAVPRPLFASGRIIGVESVLADGARGVWVASSERGRGHGDRLARRLWNHVVVVPDDPGLLGWWAERGYAVAERRDGWCRLRPPTEVREAASVCLFDPIRRRVLLGRRTRPPTEGRWAFPGGALEPGEQPLEAALRELTEETGLRAEGPPLHTEVVHVAAEQTMFRITCFVLPDFREPSPSETDEMSAAWFDLDEALALRPIAGGTLRVLRRLAAPSA